MSDRLVCGVDSLDEVQSLRAIEAIAILKAKRDAIESGEIQLGETHLYTWTVDVEPLDADATDGLNLVVHRQAR